MWKASTMPVSESGCLALLNNNKLFYYLFKLFIVVKPILALPTHIFNWCLTALTFLEAPSTIKQNNTMIAWASLKLFAITAILTFIHHWHIPKYQKGCWVEIPVKNCIVGMLLTCPIDSAFCFSGKRMHHVSNHMQSPYRPTPQKNYSNSRHSVNEQRPAVPPSYNTAMAKRTEAKQVEVGYSCYQ